MFNLPPLPNNFNRAAEFPSLARWHFFQHSGVSPIPHRSAEVIRQYAAESEHDAYLTGKWYKRAETTRQRAAQLINASPQEIAFIKNTSEGIAFVSNGLDWKPGDEIISTNVEYPANVYPWMDAAERHGVKHIMLNERPDGRILPEDILAAVTPRTRLIALSHVEYGSGFRIDIAPIGKFCRERNILFCVDAIQSVGALPVDVQSMHIDFLSAGGHKWMLSPEGIGIFYCRRELFPHLRPEIGWANVINATDYDNINFTLRNDAKRFECGGYNHPGVLALGESLNILLELGDLVWKRIYALTQLLYEGLREKGYHVFSPRNHESECSGIVSFTSPTHDHQKVLQHLESQKIILVQRAKRLRAAPHFYQDESNIQALLDALPSHG